MIMEMVKLLANNFLALMIAKMSYPKVIFSNKSFPNPSGLTDLIKIIMMKLFYNEK